MYFSPVPTILEAILQLPSGCQDGSPSPSDNYDTYFFCFIKPSTFEFVKISATFLFLIFH